MKWFEYICRSTTKHTTLYSQRQETETPQPSTDTQPADEEPPVEEVWTPLLEQADGADHQPSAEELEQLQGGAVWGGRVCRNVQSSDCFQTVLNKYLDTESDNLTGE